MCDYSLHDISTRPAKVGDKLVSRDFGTGTRGFAASECQSVAVCLLPGTEIAFAEGITIAHRNFFGWKKKETTYRTAIFRQINKETANNHHDALEFPDGHVMLLTMLQTRQRATVLQLPAKPTTPREAEAQTRVAYIG
jgi:hypothetical protein